MSGAHIIVGTAGHVDHGKTLLTQALTGVNTDRLPEEKRRGMTIVPGFVALELKSGRRLGLIDVPGHERFVKNMLAGVAGIDMALLVVAADEGVMPQTVEHLNILNLLGIRKGVVAITKRDLVDDEWAELVREEVTELLQPTALRDAPVLDVSAATGFHMEELRELLDQVAATVEERPASGRCRMPVDRVFTKQGFGTVATGTLWAGQIEAGQRLELLPGGAELRVRGIQVHGEAVERAQAGQRTAVNLAGPGVEQVTPGCWLSDAGLLRESYRLDVSLDLLPGARPVGQRTRVRIFHGTREVLGRVRLLDRTELEAGQSCLCQLELEQPLPPLRGDRVILRTYSPVITMAGATILDPEPPRYRLSDPGTMAAIGRKAQLDAGEGLLGLLEDQAALLSLSGLAEAARLSQEEVAGTLSLLEEAGRVERVTVDGMAQYCSAAQDGLWRQRMLELLAAYHKKYPLRRGMPAAQLHQRVFEHLSARQFATLLERYGVEGLVRSLPGGLVARGDFNRSPTPRQQADLRALEAPFLEQPFTPPAWQEVTAELHIGPEYAPEYLVYLLEQGRLIRVGNSLFSAGAVKEAERLLRAHFNEFTMAQARDLLGSTRKYVLTLLEYFDGIGLTVREGDSRHFLR